MADEPDLTFRRSADSEFLELLRNFLQTLSGQNFRSMDIVFAILPSAIRFDRDALLADKLPKQLQQCTGFTRLIKQVVVHSDQAEVTLDRYPHKDDSLKLKVKTHTSRDHQPDYDVAGFEILADAQRSFGSISSASFVTLLNQQSQTFLDANYQAIAEMRMAVSQLATELASRRADLEAEVQAEKSKHESEYKAKAKALDEKTIETEARLKDEEVRLRAVAEEQNLKLPIAERRKVFENLQRELEKLNVSYRFNRETLFLFGLSFMLFAAAIWVSGAAAYQYVKTLTSLTGNESDWVLLGKSVVTSLAFVSVVVWSIRWMKSWGDRITNEQFRLRRLKFDMDRAHWLAELCFQWEEKFEGELPEHIAKSLGAGLFTNEGELHESPNFESILTLLAGASTKLRFGRDSVELRTSPERRRRETPRSK